MNIFKLSGRSLLKVLLLIFAVNSGTGCNGEDQEVRAHDMEAGKPQTRSISDLRKAVKNAETKVEKARQYYQQELDNLQIQQENLAAQQLLNSSGIALFVDDKPGGTFKVYNSTFNELVDAIEPIKRSGSHPVTKTIRLCIPFTDYCYSRTVTVCGGTYDAEVLDTEFSVTTAGIDIDGKVSGIFKCGIDLHFSSNLATTAQATYNPDANALLVTTESTSIEPCVHVPVVDRNICLGFSVNVAPTLSYRVPVTTANLYFETSDGLKHVRITPETVGLHYRTGYIEIASDVLVW